MISKETYLRIAEETWEKFSAVVELAREQRLSDVTASHSISVGPGGKEAVAASLGKGPLTKEWSIQLWVALDPSLHSEKGRP